MYTGPHLIKDNLVFGYDTGYGIEQHSSTRHYKGEPATNLITAGLPGYFGSGGETVYKSKYYGLNSDSGVFQRNYVTNPATANTSAFNNNAGLYKNFTTATLSSSTEYVLVSFDFYMKTPYVRHSSATTGLNGYLGIGYTDGTNSSISWNTSLNTPNAGDDWNNNSAYIGKWRKIALYVQVNSSKTPSSIVSMYIYNDKTTQGEGIFTNFVITEHTTAPTGPILYTSGTRSSTQSLIDLKKSTDINVATTSFDSTGQPTFDGTDDYIYPNNITNGSGLTTITAEFVVKATANSKNIIKSNSNAILLHYGGAGFYLNSTDGTTSGYLGWNSKLTGGTGVYEHLVATYDGTTMKLYVNGDSTGTTRAYSAGSTGILKDLNGVTIGGNFNSTQPYFNGDIPIAKIHNRALTAGEVKQNFNAYKNRFDI